ncbi:MAG: AAA family ATPase, partial [Candidatus Dormibacteraeota bacterium]|nr:AAA family ATPase [Candidatus Dormibacteraeota bacterium]
MTTNPSDTTTRVQAVAAPPAPPQAPQRQSDAETADSLEPRAPAPSVEEPAPAEDTLTALLPSEVVRRLDEYIIGQGEAKRKVAIALRNRYRRQRLPEQLREEVLPKNILMIGPTGVGKTEIARRVARLTDSPFIKVEATKFTEVGYVGRDVEAIVRDLLEQTITEVHNDRIDEVEEEAKRLANARLADALLAMDERERAAKQAPPAPGTEAPQGEPTPATEGSSHRARRRRIAKRLAAGQLEERPVEIEVEEPFQPAFEGFAGTGLEEVGVSLSDFFSQLAPV